MNVGVRKAGLRALRQGGTSRQSEMRQLDMRESEKLRHAPRVAMHVACRVLGAASQALGTHRPYSVAATLQVAQDVSLTPTGEAGLKRGGVSRLLLDFYRPTARLVAAILLLFAPALVATPGTVLTGDGGGLYYDLLATFDVQTDRPISVVASKSFTGARTCIAFKTHEELTRCYVEGSALLVASPAAKQYDGEFPSVHAGDGD